MNYFTGIIVSGGEFYEEEIKLEEVSFWVKLDRTDC